MRKSLFLLLDLKRAPQGKRLVMPIPLFVLDDALTGFAHLARLILWVAPGLSRRLKDALGADPEVSIDMASGMLTELRSYGSWTMVDVKSRKTRVRIRFY